MTFISLSKQALFSLLWIFLFNVAAAQNRSCFSDEHQKWMMQQDAGYAARFTRQFQDILALEASGSRSSGIDSVIIIPVVVHVLWNGTGENISDEQIKSQIDVLNEDFSGLNVSRLDIPGPLQNLVKDSKIRFCLARRDTTGNLFNGIVRVETPIDQFNLFDPRIYSAALGGSNAWPRDAYMNIWCTSLENNALGYANFPSGPAGQDGIVINSRAFGRMGNVKSPYNLGRTSTHESGHWMNLYHIWGDDGGDCTGTDQINDTPPQGDSHFRCPSFPASDLCSPGDTGTYYMNYLDYTDDQCMMFFTLGQINRMRNTFVASRLPLLTSPASTYPVVNGTEAEIDSVLTPVFEVAERCFKPTIRVHNIGSSGLVNPSFRYRLSNGLWKRFSSAMLIPANSSVMIDLPEIAGTPGNELFEVWLELNDLVKSNNFISASFRVNAAAKFTCGNTQPLVIPNPVGIEQKACLKTNYSTSRLITLSVYDVAGRLVVEQVQMVNPGDAIPVNLQTVQGGVYLARLKSDESDDTVKFVYQPDSQSAGLSFICN